MVRTVPTALTTLDGPVQHGSDTHRRSSPQCPGWERPRDRTTIGLPREYAGVSPMPYIYLARARRQKSILRRAKHQPSRFDRQRHPRCRAATDQERQAPLEPPASDQMHAGVSTPASARAVCASCTIAITTGTAICACPSLSSSRRDSLPRPREALFHVSSLTGRPVSARTTIGSYQFSDQLSRVAREAAQPIDALHPAARRTRKALFADTGTGSS